MKSNCDTIVIFSLDSKAEKELRKKFKVNIFLTLADII